MKVFLILTPDPWQWASLRHSKGAIISQIADCDDCAHCADLHVPNSKDPRALSYLRINEMTSVKKWLTSHWNQVNPSILT